MKDKLNGKEGPAKRSLTPNRSIYNSFDEAHRRIAPPTPKLPIDQDLGSDEPLTPEQVEDILRDNNPSKGTRELANNVNLEQREKLEYSSHSVVGDQPGKSTKVSNPAPLSAIESHRDTVDQGKAADCGHASISSCGSEDEHAFLEVSVSSIEDGKGKGIANDTNDTNDDPFAGELEANNYPDASSFYPDDGEGFAYSPDSTEDEFVLENIKLEPKSSPVLASLPKLPPPVASNPLGDYQKTQQAHLDDIIKNPAASDYFDTTHISGQNGSHYPLFIDNGTLSSPRNPHPVPTQPTQAAIKEGTKTGSQNDADVSDISIDHFVNQDKDKASVSCLNPFHAFSAESSHDSEMNVEQSEPEIKKVFLRPHAEKEVSCALRHVTGISQPSSGLISGRNHSSRIHNLGADSPYTKRSGQTQDGFYHTPTIQPSWKVAQSVKVPILPPPDEMNVAETEPYNTLDNTRMATVASTAEERTRLDGDEDWRTVNDDHEFPNGAVGRVMTGSSIANVSDAFLIQRQHVGRVPSATGAWWDKVADPSPPSPSLPTLPSPPAATWRRRPKQGWEEFEMKPMPSMHKDFSWNRDRDGAAEQAKSGLGQVSHKEYANLPFPLVAREDAARLQAVRRASGLEDQTLSGRVLSPGLRSSIQGSSSYALPHPALRKDSAQSTFSHIRNPSRDLFIPEHLRNSSQRDYHGYRLPPRLGTSRFRERTASASSNPNKMSRINHQAAAEALAIDRHFGRPTSPHLVTSEVLTRYRALQSVRYTGGHGTDSELADMAGTIDDLPLSDRARRRQQIFYRAVMATTIFLPFIGYVVLACHADSMLSGFTGGECSGLSFFQRRNLRIMLLIGFGVWAAAVATGLIALAATRN